MKPFTKLTAKGQLQRLRQLALAALSEYDISVSKVRTLAYLYNTIFRVDTADGRKWILRINIPDRRTPGEINAEMAWLSALGQDTGVSLPIPLANRHGAFITPTVVPGVPEQRNCVLFSWVPGRDLAHQMTAGNYFTLGRLAARLHEHAGTFELPPDCQLGTGSTVLPAYQSNMLCDGAELVPLDGPRQKLFQDAFDRVQAEIDFLYAEPTIPRILHGDLHQGNIRVSRGNLHVIDFDDCFLGFPVQDIGITLFYISHRDDYVNLRAAFQRGYSSQSPWPEAHPGQLESLIAGRGLLLANFLLGSTNPLHQQMAPHFVNRLEDSLRQFMRS